ncbi:MAG: response regulator [Roseiflexaceae bacterium]|nr:response regulator [Roseiflexaceae bacterium]
MNPVRIVLADDHAVVRAGIANALRELSDLEIVDELGDGTTLLATLERSRPDMLVTDVTMPNFEPISAIREIRARMPLLKILIISAYDDDTYVQGLLGVGVNGYHLKDQPLSDLRLAVQRVLAGERWICHPLVDKLVRAREASSNTAPLTARQHDLLRCLSEGLDNQAIARRTGLSVKTIENHLTRLYRQLNVQSRIEAVHYLIQHPGMLRPMETTPATAAGVVSAHSPSQPAILIVDDNMRYRTQMRRMVGKSCPQALIAEAENIQIAVRLANDMRPQLVFVDVVLGDENGIECVRQIKAHLPATRIVLISAYPDREFHRLGIAAGAVAFLDKKDLNAAALREVIEDLIG